jgi:hypothetical protein
VHKLYAQIATLNNIFYGCRVLLEGELTASLREVQRNLGARPLVCARRRLQEGHLRLTRVVRRIVCIPVTFNRYHWQEARTQRIGKGY